VQGAQPLTKGDDGVWSVTLGPLAPAIYSYTFRVNGVGVLDPVNPMIQLGERGSSSMFEVPGDIPATYDFQNVPHGSREGGWLPDCIAGNTGVGMSQRMQSFVLDSALNPFNVLEPYKKPRVTLTPSLAMKDGKPFLSFAVQGGDAVWEGLRLYHGKIFKLKEHLDRLRSSAIALAFSQIPSHEEWVEQIRKTLSANQMQDGVHIRLTLTRGVKITSGMDPRLNQSGPTLIILAEHKPFNTRCKSSYTKSLLTNGTRHFELSSGK
jgi:hypothetical protein